LEPIVNDDDLFDLARDFGGDPRNRFLKPERVDTVK
jgi:hypothetical protein